MRTRAREAGAPRRDGGAPLLCRTSCQIAGRGIAPAAQGQSGSGEAPDREMQKSRLGNPAAASRTRMYVRVAYGTASWLSVPAVSARREACDKAHIGWATTSADGYRHEADSGFVNSVILRFVRRWRYGFLGSGFRAGPASLASRRRRPGAPKCSEAAGEFRGGFENTREGALARAACYVMPPTTGWWLDNAARQSARCASGFVKQVFMGTSELIRPDSTSVNIGCSRLSSEAVNWR